MKAVQKGILIPFGFEGTTLTVLPRLYGDTIPVGGNGVIDVDDLWCALDAFTDMDACPQGDIAPCGGNGFIDMDDVLHLGGRLARQVVAAHVGALDLKIPAR